MGTIITVHGTGAAGPVEGNAWWQRGSLFEGHVRELVEAEAGALAVERLSWDGLNSEASRRAAATELFTRIRALENAQQRYVLVGHSHGGSIVAAALLLAASEKNDLPNLAQWVTVGTPFIRFTKSRWLFSRVNLSGKAFIATAVAVLLSVALSALPIVALTWADMNHLAEFAIMQLAAFAIPYAVLSSRNKKRYFMFRQDTIRRARHAFLSRWRGLYHRDDEAISALRNLPKLSVPFFERHFAVTPLTFASLFVLPVILLLGALFSGYFFRFFPTSITDSLEQQSLLIQRSSYMLTMGIVQELVSNATGQLFDWVLALFPHSDTVGPYDHLIRDVPLGILNTVLTFLLIVGFLYGLSLIILYLTTITARLVSSIASRGLNAATWSQIRRAGFGGDTIGETAEDVAAHPMWSTHIAPALPDALSKEVSEVSDAAASVAIPKLRRAITELATSKDKEARLLFLEEVLTWDELIHTSYFNVARFRMLVAYGIAVSPGFRPSRDLESHPDFQLIADWYRLLQPQPTIEAA